MAIDYEAVFETLHEIQTKVDEMVVVVGLVNDGGYAVPELGFIDFSVGEMGSLKSAYSSKKSDLATLYADLP